MDFGGSEEVEMTLMNKRPCNVFQIPPISSAAGHRAEDWRGKQMWRGFCKITMVGASRCKITFVNEDGTNFAQSSFSSDNYDNVVQRCVDSSRFFAILLYNEQTGQKANIGVQFPERNDSFDFVGGLDQFVKHYRIERGLDKQKINVSSSSMSSFAIKEGQKMTLNISMGDGKRIGGHGAYDQKPKTGGGLKALKKPLAPLSKPGQTASGSNGNVMGFGMGSAGSAGQSAPAQKEEIDLLGVQQEPQANDGPTDLLSALGHDGAAQQPSQPQTDFFSQLPAYPGQENNQMSQPSFPQSNGGSSFVPMPGLDMSTQPQPAAITQGNPMYQQPGGFMPQAPPMSMGSMPSAPITKTDEAQPKSTPFAFDVFGKGVKQTEATDNGNASMGFDDLFGGMKDSKPAEVTAAQQNGGGSYQFQF